MPAGDYALLNQQRIVAVVKRKTLENFLTNLSQLKGLQQQLAELSAYPHAARAARARFGACAAEANRATSASVM